MLINLTDKNFQKEVIENNKLVLVEFEANWSGSSYLISSILETLSDEFNGYVKFGIMDIDSNKRITEKFCIHTIPTLLFFKDGEVVDCITGIAPRETIIEKIQTLLL